MRLLILFGLVASSIAAPSGGYRLPTPSGGGGAYGGGGRGGGRGGGGGGRGGGRGYGGNGGRGGGGSGEGYGGNGGGGGGGGGDCSGGQVPHVDGSCVEPIVSRSVYIYSAPDLPVSTGPAPNVPKPKVNYNIVFVRTPEGPSGVEPIVVPPPQQKTLVYVLTKGDELNQQVIEVPAGPASSPEVFYVNYNDGDNPQLMAGIDLQTALSSAKEQEGQFIDGGSGGGGGGGNGGGNGGGYGGGNGGGNGGYGGGQPQPPSQSYGTP